MSASTSRPGPRPDLILDSVLTSQPELGPSAPDGGYGWVVFLATLFFQALLPSMIVSFGIFLAHERLIFITANDIEPLLWDKNLLYVPLAFIVTWTVCDPRCRQLVVSSTWPRLVATAGTCLTCAGLLFFWMALTGYGMVQARASSTLYALAGALAGFGASLQMSQCEILVAQYFRTRHSQLVHLSHAISSLGFVVAPIAVGHHVINSSAANVVLWYQAIILQGLVLNLVFRKPAYLKATARDAYNYISAEPDDEEDIFSKNARELQIRSQTSNGTTVLKHELPSTNNDGAGSSNTTENTLDKRKEEPKKNWVKFENEEAPTASNNVSKEWETFDEELAPAKNGGVLKKTDKNWETFEDENESQSNRSPKNLQLEMALVDEKIEQDKSFTSTITGLPIPLFSDLPVNNNNTYSYEVLDDQTRTDRPAVFQPTTQAIPTSRLIYSSLEILQQPTFYKSLLTFVTTKFSIFVFYALFPSYLLQEVSNLKLGAVATIVGSMSWSSLLFAGMSYWVNIDKKRRPYCLWFLCWLGGLGYYMISDYHSEYLLIFGAVLVTLSIATLQHIGAPLVGLTIRGETTKEYNLISILCGAMFLFFYLINCRFKDCFRLMALLHFACGAIWSANYFYKRFIKT